MHKNVWKGYTSSGWIVGIFGDRQPNEWARLWGILLLILCLSYDGIFFFLKLETYIFVIKKFLEKVPCVFSSFIFFVLLWNIPHLWLNNYYKSKKSLKLGFFMWRKEISFKRSCFFFFLVTFGRKERCSQCYHFGKHILRVFSDS